MLKLFQKKLSYKTAKAQLELNIRRTPEADRNLDKGGRSFYFFDFDDNIAVLSTPIIIFHKESNVRMKVSSRDFGEHSGDIGRRGLYKDYIVRYDGPDSSFQFFRDRNLSLVEKLRGKKQIFIQDLVGALGLPDYHWQGPSWSCFYHAVFNKRPISLITARGHHPETIKAGIRLLVEKNHIPHEPNYLAIYPINNPEVRIELGGGAEVSVAEMKQAAIQASVMRAFEVYGFNSYHRFGMSDDDPNNIDLIIKQMRQLKREFPENSFFVFDTQRGQFLRREIFDGHTRDQVVGHASEQLALFEP